MKKLTALVLVSMLCLCFFACGDDTVSQPILPNDGTTNTPAPNGTQGTTAPSQAVATTAPSDAVTDPTLTTTAPTEAATEPTEVPTEPTEPIVIAYMDSLQASYLADTAGGFHITEYETNAGEETHACIDSDGMITFVLSEDETPLTGVYEGVFVSQTDDEVYIRKAIDGTLVFEQSLDENTIVVPWEAPFTDGYVAYVVRKSETYQGVSYEMGIVDADGNWAMPMTKNVAMFNYLQDGGTLDYFENEYYENFRYCGENLIIFETSDFKHSLYNFKQNTTAPVACDDLAYEPFMSLLFQNGKSAPFYQYGRNLVLYSDGTHKELDVNPAGGHLTDVSQPHWDPSTDTLYYLRGNNIGEYAERNMYVSDHSGNIIGTTNQASCSHTYGFVGDVAPVILDNQEGTKYYTVVDLQGNFLFEPVKIDACYVVDTQSGLILNPSNSASEASDWFVVIDRNGQILHKLEISNPWHIPGINCKNGVLKYDDHYIDLR